MVWCGFIVYIKGDDIYKDTAEDVETRFTYELEKPLLKGRNEKIVGLMKDESGGKIMTNFFELIAKTYSYLIDGSIKDKKKQNTWKSMS